MIIADIAMQQSEFNALKELLTIGAIAPGIVSTIIGMIVVLFIARIVNSGTKPVMALVVATNENFEKVLMSSEQATQRYEQRVQKHEEAGDRFVEVMDSHHKAAEANTAVLIELKNNILEHNRIEAERNKELLSFVGGLVNSVKQDVAVHDQHATQRYAEIAAQLQAIQTEIHTVLKDIDKEIKALSAKPATMIDFTPVITPLVAIQKSLDTMAAQLVWPSAAPIMETKET